MKILREFKLIITDKYYPMLFVLLFAVIAISGGLTNMSVMVQNGNKMPVHVTPEFESIYFEDLNDATHFSYTEEDEVQLHFFTDHNFLYVEWAFFSFGDYVIYIGLFGMMLIAIPHLILNLRMFINRRHKK